MIAVSTHMITAYVDELSLRMTACASEADVVLSLRVCEQQGQAGQITASLKFDADNVRHGAIRGEIRLYSSGITFASGCR